MSQTAELVERVAGSHNYSLVLPSSKRLDFVKCPCAENLKPLRPNHFVAQHHLTTRF